MLYRGTEQLHSDYEKCDHSLHTTPGNYECIATPGRPMPCQFSFALITMPCQVWSHWTYPLPFIAFLLLIHYFNQSINQSWIYIAHKCKASNALILHAVTLTCDLVNICSVSPAMWWNYVPNLNAIELSAMELLQL